MASLHRTKMCQRGSASFWSRLVNYTDFHFSCFASLAALHTDQQCSSTRFNVLDITVRVFLWLNRGAMAWCLGAVEILAEATLRGV